jgi:hypothetical protein
MVPSCTSVIYNQLALQTLYPEHHFTKEAQQLYRNHLRQLQKKQIKQIQREQRATTKDSPRKRWTEQQQRSFLDQLAVKLNIQKPEDWYHVRRETVMKMGGTFVAQHGSLTKGNYLIMFDLIFQP